VTLTHPNRNPLKGQHHGHTNLADIRFGDADGDTLSLDESLALRTAASRLVGEFAGVFGAEMIERFLHPSFDQFAPLMVITMGCGDASPPREALRGLGSR